MNPREQLEQVVAEARAVYAGQPDTGPQEVDVMSVLLEDLADALVQVQFQLKRIDWIDTTEVPSRNVSRIKRNLTGVQQQLEAISISVIEAGTDLNVIGY